MDLRRRLSPQRMVAILRIGGLEIQSLGEYLVAGRIEKDGPRQLAWPYPCAAPLALGSDFPVQRKR
jgi:hypothetical protein